MQIFSIFNDILGPVLTGPSSSHTAGPCRIGYMAGHLVEGKVKKVMAGEEGVIPFDETICSRLDVGNMMPPELCCTNSGGLAICRTSLELADKLNA